MNKLRLLALAIGGAGFVSCSEQNVDESQPTDPFGAGPASSSMPSEEKPMTPINFERDFTLDTTLSKLRGITFPSFEITEDIPLVSVLSLIQSRSVELDNNEADPFERGIHFDIFDWRRVKGTADYDRELSPYRPLSLKHDDERWTTGGLEIQKFEVNLGDLISEIASEAKLEVYLSSQGIVLVPEGQDPNPTNRRDVSIWQPYP